MHLYNCKVRLAGQLHNEVYKPQVSAAEVLILKTIHGDDAVVGLERAGKGKPVHDQLRRQLEDTYERGLRGARTSMTELFGPRHQPLPEKLPSYVLEDDEDDADAEPKRSAPGRPPKQQKSEAPTHETLVE